MIGSTQSMCQMGVRSMCMKTVQWHGGKMTSQESSAMSPVSSSSTRDACRSWRDMPRSATSISNARAICAIADRVQEHGLLWQDPWSSHQGNTQGKGCRGSCLSPRKGLPKRMMLRGTWLQDALCASASASSPGAAVPVAKSGGSLSGWYISRHA